MTPAEIVRKAAGIIAEKGWAQGTLVDPEGRVCHNGAIYEACQVDANTSVIPQDSPPSRIIQASAGLLRKKGIGASPACFNDMDTTTAEDIILHLKELAAWLEDNELPEAEVLYPGQFFSAGETDDLVLYTGTGTITLPAGYTFTWSAVE